MPSRHVTEAEGMIPGLFERCSRLTYVDIVHQSGDKREEQWCIYRHHRFPFGLVADNIIRVEKLGCGYPDYWWHVHDDAISEEIRASIGL